jgi:hypothetical protein
MDDIDSAERVSSLMQKYPGRIPVRFVGKDGKRFGNEPTKKFLIPADMNMGEVSALLHRHLTRSTNIKNSETLYLCTQTNHIVPKCSTTIESLYEETQSTTQQPELMTILYCTENTLG